jgi:hypothetical protein
MDLTDRCVACGGLHRGGIGEETRARVRHRAHPRRPHELASSEAIERTIFAGLGISSLSRHAITLNAPDQFAVLDAEGKSRIETDRPFQPYG